MQTNTRRRLVTGVLVLVLLGALGSVCLFSSAVTAQQPCADTWWQDPSRAERDRCAELKTDRIERLMRDEEATAHSLPPQVAPTVDVRVNGTPRPQGYIPPEAQKITKLTEDDIAEVKSLRGTNSVWKVGSVLLSDGLDYVPLYIWSRPPTDGKHATIGMSLLQSDRFMGNKYRRTWEVPHDVGTLTITGVTGQQGVVSFTTSNGMAGTFDLTNETWSIEA